MKKIWIWIIVIVLLILALIIGFYIKNKSVSLAPIITLCECRCNGFNNGERGFTAKLIQQITIQGRYDCSLHNNIVCDTEPGTGKTLN